MQESSLTSKKARILVVDDEPVNVKLLEVHLMTDGYEVITASGGKEALEKIASDTVDLILLDVMMPELDGYEVTRRLKSDEKTRLIPIVLLTSLRETEDRIRGIEAGCDDFISKPFNKNEVLARIRSLLKMSYYRSLLDDKEKFEYVLNHMNEGLLVLDPTLKVVRFNKKAQDLLGISLLSDHFEFSRYLKEAFRVHYSGDLIENMKGQVVNFDLERPETNDQKPLILLVRSSIVKNALNEVTSIVLLLNDVTEIRREEFKREMFLDFISHKMRTPLTVIKEYLGILKDDILGPLNDKQKEVVENSFEQSLIFKRMIEKLLGFSAISSRDVGKMREETELNSVLTNLLKSFSQEIGPQKIEYTLDFEKEKIKTDMGQDSIQLIMTNLIENAIEFNDHKPTHIKIGVKEVNAQIEISVSDDGRGIPSDIQEQIFEQFYQVDKFEAGNIQGLGMGLAIVKRLVTGYGGEIRVSSQVGKGSTFFFTVPPYVFLPKVGVERPVVNKPGRRRSMR